MWNISLQIYVSRTENAPINASCTHVHHTNLPYYNVVALVALVQNAVIQLVNLNVHVATERQTNR
jgi:hypothetical protein